MRPITEPLRRAAVGCVVAVVVGGSLLVAAVDPTPVPSCAGRPATVVGTPVSDVLVATAGPDVIHGLGGDDTVLGVEGDDVVCGGPGQDTVHDVAETSDHRAAPAP